jgi:putative ABC transport system permease protein
MEGGREDPCLRTPNGTAGLRGHPDGTEVAGTSMKQRTARPPRLAEKIVARLIDPLLVDRAMGDLEEHFRWLASKKGRTIASLWYILQIMPVLRSFILNSASWGGAMIKNYLKTALRNLRKQKGYSLLNISGLALGMACSILIVFYIHHELSYDRFHANVDRIFRVTMEGMLNGEPIDVAVTPNPLAPFLSSDYPEVISAARIRMKDTSSVAFADKEFIESGIVYADPAAFDVFTFPFLRRDAQTALERPHTVVLTEGTARKYFGQEDPLGKFLRFDDSVDYAVTGVIKDVPQNSHLRFDLVCSMETFLAANPELRDDWFSGISDYTYVRLDRPAGRKPLEAKLASLVEAKMGKVLKAFKGKIQFHLQPLADIHLHSKLQWEFGANGDVLYVYIFAAIAVIILAIACINFMNLATARSARRAREIALRKVVGARRLDLVGQFLGESTSAGLLALVVALVFVKLALPLFRSVSGIEPAIGAAQLAWLIPVFFGLVIFIGLAAGSYPALYLSALRPADALKGDRGGGGIGSGNARFRRFLVIGQFVLSVSMIIGTLVIRDQVRYMKDKDLGFQKDQVLAIRTSDGNVLGSPDQVKARLKEIPGVLEVSVASRVPGQLQSTNGVLPEGSESVAIYRFIHGDADYVRTMGMTIVRGRDFSKDILSDAKNAVLINEAAVRKLGWAEPIGKTIKIMLSANTSEPRTVVGVVKDFHFSSLREAIEPLIITNGLGELEVLAVRFRAADTGRLVGELRRAWKVLSPRRPFDCFFIDELFDAKFRSEERLNKIFASFSFLAILIACLGLFGLASFLAEKMKREIGIRKVFGASIGQLVGRLSREFLVMVGAAALVAWPIAYVAMSSWLRGFAYRTNLHPWIFVGAGLAALAIAFLTVSYQALRAASANPVDSLKYE